MGYNVKGIFPVWGIGRCFTKSSVSDFFCLHIFICALRLILIVYNYTCMLLLTVELYKPWVNHELKKVPRFRNFIAAPKTCSIHCQTSKMKRFNWISPSETFDSALETPLSVSYIFISSVQSIENYIYSHTKFDCPCYDGVFASSGIVGR